MTQTFLKYTLTALLWAVTFSLYAQPATSKAKKGEGVSELLQRNHLVPARYDQAFRDLNPGKFTAKGGLIDGVTYKLPRKGSVPAKGAAPATTPNKNSAPAKGNEAPENAPTVEPIPMETAPVGPEIGNEQPAVKGNKGAAGANGREPLFGPKYANCRATSHELSGAVFYLVSGHGGPDPGAIGKYNGHDLHEDEYAYDIILRLGRELLMRGAKVYIIIQDPKDGIRDAAVLNNSKNETCMGEAIPLDQVKRLNQRCYAINRAFQQDNSNYKRAVFIHVDSRSKGTQTDVFFYHAEGSTLGKRLAKNIHSTFQQKYGRHQPNRGFRGTVSSRSLHVLRNTTPAAVFLEVGNIQNAHDQKRLVIADNRQALANWITAGIIADYKEKK
jgi:N-acetylmuramoyl-L-alanine amidase